MSAKNATFDGYDFAANGLTITELDMYSRAPKRIQLEDLAVEDGAVQVSTRYGAKPISITGSFRPRATTEQLESDIRMFIMAMIGDERALDIPDAGDTIRFIATAEAPLIKRYRGGATTAEFNVTFIVPSSYGSDLTPLTLISQTFNAQSIDIPMLVGGSYKAQPDITLTINTVTGGGPNKTLNLFNPATTEGLIITRNWVAGDSLTFNARDRQVYLNNTQIFARGAFPSWQPGNQVLSYFDDFSTRNVTLLVTYTRHWS